MRRLTDDCVNDLAVDEVHDFSEDLRISWMQSLAQEVLEARATFGRLEEWAQALEKAGGSGVGVFIAMELRNRIKGTT